jgi:2Fe-2S ferredoxin
MGGVNPYIAKPVMEKPKKRYSLTLIDEATNATTTIEVDPEKIPYSHTGQEGSILDIALGSGVEINHSCGGVCACSTCHVIVRQGLKSCSEATEDEEEELDNAPGLTTESRLACQCVPNGTEDLVVVIPAWNKNLVKEGH